MMESDELMYWMCENTTFTESEFIEELTRRLDEDVLVEALRSIKKDIEDGNL